MQASFATATSVCRRRKAVVPLRGGSLESALPATKATPAAFWFSGTTSEVHPRGCGAVVHERRASHRWTRGSVSRFTDTETTPVELGTVELLDRFWHRGRVTEFDEREPARLVGCAVDRQEHFFYRTHLGEQRFEIRLGRLVAEVSDEDS